MQDRYVRHKIRVTNFGPEDVTKVIIEMTRPEFEFINTVADTLNKDKPKYAPKLVIEDLTEKSKDATESPENNEIRKHIECTVHMSDALKVIGII